MKIEFFKYGIEITFNSGSYFIICLCSFELSWTRIYYDGWHKDLKLGFIEFNWLSLK